MALALEVASGPDKGRRLLLQPGESRHVGRSEDADFQLRGDEFISRTHFMIECTETAGQIRDLHSGNGTFLNGKRVSNASVGDGDTIKAGDTTLVVRIERRGRVDTDPAKPVASPAAELANVKASPPDSPGLKRHPSPAASTVRRSPARRPYDVALADAEPNVRHQALLAAAWGRQPFVLEHCRRAALRPSLEDLDSIFLLAILGQPLHLDLISSLAPLAKLGPKRFQVLGAFGHPGVVPSLLDALEDEDALTAVAAADAFSKITGAEIESAAIVSLAPQDPDNEEDEAQEDVSLPDARAARAHWHEVKARYAKATRWCRGFDLSRGITPGVLENLDMESRREACLRGKFEGTWHGSLIDLERFPMKRS